MFSLSIVLLLFAGASGLFAIACEERAAGRPRVAGRHRAFYLLKPLTTVLILGAAACADGADPTYRSGVCIALLLSLCGDVALMFEGNVAFMAGLGSFLLAHGVFVWVLLGDGLAAPPVWTGGVVVAALAFFVWLLPRTGSLRIPVVAYGLALIAMSLSAAARADLRDDLSGLLALVGSLLFLLSDSALAVRQFKGPYVRAQALILSTYWLAVGMLAASVAGSAVLAP